MAHVGNAFENSCILTAVGVAAIIVNSFVISKYGRRRLFLMVGMAFCGVTQLIVACVYDAQPNTSRTGKVIVAMSVLYIMGYNVRPLLSFLRAALTMFQGMVATYAWLAGGEIPSQRLRSYTFGVAASIGFMGAWLATFTAPYFINPASLGWGPKYGYIWAPSCFITVIWVFFFLPEIKNRTLEEIDEMVRHLTLWHMRVESTDFEYLISSKLDCPHVNFESMYALGDIFQMRSWPGRVPRKKSGATKK